MSFRGQLLKHGLDLSRGQSTFTLSTSGTAKKDMLRLNWVAATTYGSGGDRWGGTGSMEACLAIGNDGTAAVISGAGAHLGQYINISYTGTAGAAADLVGGLFACITYGADQTQGKNVPITAYVRNPDKSVKGSSQECNAIRALMYTGTGGETNHYCGILVSTLDMTTTKSVAMDIIGIRIQHNVANAAQGGNLSGVVLDNVGTVEADRGIWFLNNKWTYAMAFADGVASPKPATDDGTVGTQSGAIAVIVGGSVRYIPLYSVYTAA